MLQSASVRVEARWEDGRNMVDRWRVRLVNSKGKSRDLIPKKSMPAFFDSPIPHRVPGRNVRVAASIRHASALNLIGATDKASIEAVLDSSRNGKHSIHSLRRASAQVNILNHVADVHR
jgi:hypothetical protein